MAARTYRQGVEAAVRRLRTAADERTYLATLAAAELHALKGQGAHHSIRTSALARQNQYQHDAELLYKLADDLDENLS